MSSELIESGSNKSVQFRHPSSFQVGSWKLAVLGQERTFIDYYLPRVRMLMLARLVAREDVDALVQQVMLDSLRGLRKGQLRSANKLTQFVLGIARIHLEQHNHLEKRADAASKPVGELPELSQAKEKAAESRQIEMAEKAIQSLDPVDLQLLTLTLVEGVRSVNLARRLSLSPDTVRQRKVRAAKQIEESYSAQSEKAAAEQNLADEKQGGCNGEPAQELGLAYLEGVLRGEDLDRFEDHTFDCALCHKEVRSLIAVREKLRQQAGQPVETTKTSKSVWPILAGVAVLALLIVGGFFGWQHYATSGNKAYGQTTDGAYPLPTEEHALSEAAGLAQMADLNLPVYVPPIVLGDKVNLHYLRGMNAYKSSDCDGADKELSLVNPPSPNNNSANFYDGACLLHLGKSDDAFAKLSLVVAAGDIPEQESAIYELAQVELTRDHLSEAHNDLVQTIALRGEHEARARAQDAKLLPLIGPRNQ